MKPLLTAITLLFVILLLLPTTTPAGSRVIGAFMSSDLPRYREAHRQMLKVLAARGHTATTEIILQTPNPDPLSWANSIRKLVAYRADLIVAYGAPAVAMALKEGDAVPVVAVDAILPEGCHAGGLCGITARVPMITLLRVLHEVRRLQKVGVLYTSRDIGSVRQLEELRRAAHQMNITLVEGNVATFGAVDSVTSSVIAKTEALIATDSSLINKQFDRIAARCRSARLPLATTLPDGADRGALASLEVSPAEQGETAGQMVSRLLEGARPEQLGVVTPRHVELVLNLKVARDLELTVPFSVLGLATRVLK